MKKIEGRIFPGSKASLSSLMVNPALAVSNL